MNDMANIRRLLGQKPVNNVRSNLLRQILEDRKPDGIGETVAFGVMCDLAFGSTMSWDEAKKHILALLEQAIQEARPMTKGPW